jgi:F-type H+-transporting ATPase subunit b
MATEAPHEVVAGAPEGVPATGTHTEAAGGHEGGLPQLRYEYWPGQIAWLLVIFAVLYVLLSKVFLPRVGGAMDARDQKIAGDMGEARALRDQAEVEAKAAESEMNEARAKAGRTAAEAKARSAAEAAERQGALEAELNEKLAAAEARIRASRDEAMGQVRGIAAETAAAIAEKLTGKPASAAEIDRALGSVGA